MSARIFDCKGIRELSFFVGGVFFGTSHTLQQKDNEILLLCAGGQAKLRAHWNVGGPCVFVCESFSWDDEAKYLEYQTGRVFLLTLALKAVHNVCFSQILPLYVILPAARPKPDGKEHNK